MKSPVSFRTTLIILFTLILAATQVAIVYGDKGTGLVSQNQGATPIVENPLLDTLGLSAADTISLTQKAKDISDKYKSTTTVQKQAISAAGAYKEDSIEKITLASGKAFEGGTTILFTISPDNKVTGTVAFKFIEQGWTIKVHGTVNGFLTPDTGKLVLKSSDASVKYAGKQNPLTMNVEAQYNGSGFDGIKVLTMSGTSGTLGFHADKA